MTKVELSEHLASSRFFACITHGAPTRLTVSDGFYMIGDLNAIPVSALADLQFVFLGACETGKDGESGENWVNTLYNKGVDFVVGYETTISVSGISIWSEAFIDTLVQGSTYSQAMESADEVMLDIYYDFEPVTDLHKAEMLIGIDVSAAYRYYIGDITVAPFAEE